MSRGERLSSLTAVGSATSVGRRGALPGDVLVLTGMGAWSGFPSGRPLVSQHHGRAIASRIRFRVWPKAKHWPAPARMP
jgi:hypothetical protein